MKPMMITMMTKPMMRNIMTITANSVSLSGYQERLSQNQERYHAVSESVC